MRSVGPAEVISRLPEPPHVYEYRANGNLDTLDAILCILY